VWFTLRFADSTSGAHGERVRPKRCQPLAEEGNRCEDSGFAGFLARLIAGLDPQIEQPGIALQAIAGFRR